MNTGNKYWIDCEAVYGNKTGCWIEYKIGINEGGESCRKPISALC